MPSSPANFHHEPLWPSSSSAHILLVTQADLLELPLITANSRLDCSLVAVRRLFSFVFEARYLRHGPSTAHDVTPRRASQETCYNSSIRKRARFCSRQKLTELQGWFIGHATLLFAVVRYGLSYITLNYASRWAQFSYRLAFLSAVATYGIVVFKAYKSRVKPGMKAQQILTMLLGDENVQYLRKLPI